MKKEYFNNIISRLNHIHDVLDRYVLSSRCWHDDNEKHYKETIESLTDTVKYQERTINNLVGIIQNKTEEGILIFVDKKGGTPIVIEDGQSIMNENVSSFSFDWTEMEFPAHSLTIEHR